jgi:hypothetical protein
MFLADAFGGDLCFRKVQRNSFDCFSKNYKVGLQPTLSANRKMEKKIAD